MKKHTILVVDSDLLRGKVLTEELKLQGYHCLQAMQIPQAEDFLFSLRPSCVILTMGELSQVGEYIYSTHLLEPSRQEVHCILVAPRGFQPSRPGDRVLDRSEPLPSLKGLVVQACKQLLGTRSGTASRGERVSSYARTGEHTSPSEQEINNAEFRLASQTGLPSVSSKPSSPGMTNELWTTSSSVKNLTEEFFTASRSSNMRSGAKSHHKATMELSSLRALNLDEGDIEENRRRPVLLWGQEDSTSKTTSNATSELENSIEQKFREVMTQDYFQILGLTPSATAHQVRVAYQSIKRNFSEERFPPAVLESKRSQFEEINQTLQEAFDVLSEPKLREMYTRRLNHQR